MKQRVWRKNLAAPLILLMMFILNVTGAGAAEDDSVATVNGVKISKKEFDTNFQAAKGQFAKVGWQESDSKQMVDLKNKVLDRLINIELLHQQSQKQGVVVESKKVDKAIAEFKNQFPDDAKFQDFLQQKQISEQDMKAEIEKSMVLKKLQDVLRVEFSETTVFGDKDAEKFYSENPDMFKQPEQVQASHILISVEENADEAAKKEAREKIEGIGKQIKDGGDFAELAKSNSSCPSSANGGDLGLFGKGQMVKPFEDAAFAMQAGEVSNIVETKFGYHIIKVTDKKAESTMSFDEVKEKLKPWLKQQEIDKKIQTYLDNLKKNAKIKRNLS